MPKSKSAVVEVALSKIQPDKDQPRRDFNQLRLNELKTSIKKHGIMSPLIVEKLRGGSFLLVDGERRYRAAKDLKLKEVPVIIQEPATEMDRLIKQFHLQEQHEGWTATEKAAAVNRLAKNMDMTVTDLSRVLSLSDRTISTYVAFGKLLNRQAFLKNKIPIKLAPQIAAISSFAKNIVFKELEETMDQEQQKEFEGAVMDRIVAGEIKKATDFTKMRDSFKSDPEYVYKFIKNSKLTPEKMFILTKAKGAFHARNVRDLSTILASNIRKGFEHNFVDHLSDSDKSAVKTVYKELDRLVAKI